MSREADLPVVAALLMLLCLLPARAGLAASPPKPEIAAIHGQVRGREAVVRFTLRNAFPPEMVEALKSGIEITFKTVVRVERVRRAWFDDQLGAVGFSRTVRYDALSRVYRLHRGRGEELLPDVLSALAAMTQYEVTVPLSDDAQRGEKYRCHVWTRLDKVGLSEPLRSILFFSSLWDLETAWTKGYLDSP